jgi:hypothetical protein
MLKPAEPPEFFCRRAGTADRRASDPGLNERPRLFLHHDGGRLNQNPP